MNKMIFPLIALLFFSKMLVAQVDTVPPVMVCKQHIEIGVPFPCQIYAYATDFIDSVMDDTPMPIDIGIRKVCTGDGFPENKISILYSMSEWGFTSVDVWARDAAGNTSSCNVTVDVLDAAGSCDPGSGIRLFTPEIEGIDDVTTHVKGSSCFYDSIDYQIPDNFIPWYSNSPGMWTLFGGSMTRPGYNLTITPSKNINPLNGVSTYDLVLIQKHILGIELLDSPWKIIAADANQDGKVTTFDIITLRKLILGITTELPNGKSWRFAPKDYVFPNPANPFQPPFPERIEVPHTADPAPSSFQFTGVKIGDVDFSADPNQ